jgi:enoyl-CoA hydratase/carnithine racemase
LSYTTFSLQQDGPILRVTLSNPPINLMSAKMMQELFQLGGQLFTDEKTKVVVFDSADPDFFIAHVDLDDLTDPNAPVSASPDINILQSLALSWQALPQITIAKMKGRVRGGGLEFVMGLQMRFAAEDARFCSPEAIGGFLACGGGTTRISLAAGPARGLEFLLTARDFSGIEAERYGLVNRALPAQELDAYVENVAMLIARRSRAVIAMHREVQKQAFSAVVEPLFAAFAAENAGFRQSMVNGEMPQTLAATMKAVPQERAYELDLPETLGRIAPTFP